MKTLRAVVPLLAAGLAGAALPLSSGPAAAVAAAEKKFSGYSATTTASPVKLEIYEPTIPIPNTPQAELEFGYTRIVADSSSSRGRASYLWPGDPVGEGAKVIIDNLHLPPQIGEPLAEQGYPMQVNSAYPSGPESEYDQPFPGTVMYTTASENETVAEAGYSSQCELDNAAAEGGGGGDGGGGGGGGAPGLPELPELPGLGALEELLTGSARSGSDSSAAERSSAPASRSFSRAGSGTSAAAEPPACQLPPQLAAIVSFGGYAAVSKTARSDEAALSRSRAAVSDVSLLGGVVTFSGVSASALSTSDGTTPVGKGTASYGTITIAGEEFAIGPEGIRAGGHEQDIPGLPDDPKAALAQLGITVTVPKPVYEQKGQRLTSTVEGLIVTIDTKTFSAAMKQLQLEQVIAQFPDDFKDLKKFLQAAVNLSPRFVVHLAYTSSRINTVQGIEIPSVVPDNDPEAEEEETSEDTSATGSSSGSTSGATGGGLASGTPSAATTSGASTQGALTDAALSSGLPPLFSIPTLLFVVALGGAAAVGSYVRRAGLLTLGAGAACSHGLNSGLPDLRRIS